MGTPGLASLCIGFGAFFANGFLLINLIRWGLKAAEQQKPSNDVPPNYADEAGAEADDAADDRARGVGGRWWVKALCIGIAALLKTFILLFAVFLAIGRWHLPAMHFVAGAAAGMVAILSWAYLTSREPCVNHR